MDIEVPEHLKKYDWYMGHLAYLRNEKIEKVEPKRANLRWADLSWANLRGADLRWADLRWADLRWADLRGANLSGANLRWADLSWANLRGADLRWADLRGANLSGADLRGADLSEAIGKLSVGSFGRHHGVAAGGYISIGCERHTFDYWLSHYEFIGEANGYTQKEISLYGGWIKLAVEMLSE